MKTKLRILYVDDSPFDRELVRHALDRDKGAFQLVIAEDRPAFEELLQTGPWDLVLSDFHILGCTGFQVLEAVQALDPGLPVIIVTGTGSEEVGVEAMKRGASDYVIKTARHLQRLPITIRAALERKRLTEAQGQSTAEIKSMLEATTEGILVVDNAGHVVHSNARYRALFNVPEALLAGMDLHALLAFVKDQLVDPEAFLSHVPFPSDVATFDTLEFKDGRVLERRSEPQMLKGKKIGRVVTFRDVTEQRAQAQAMARMTQLYAALSQINQAVVWSTTQDQLFAKICQVLVEFGGLKMAWIGWHDPAQASLRVVSQFGDEKGYLESITIRSDDSPEGRGPTGKALQEGQPVVVNDFQASQDTAPWHGAAAHSGFKASAAFPIRMEGQVRGVLSVYAGHVDFFGHKELELLVEAASDISFALDHLEGIARRKEALAALQVSEQSFVGLFNAISEAIYVQNSEGVFLTVNDGAVKMYGYAREEFEGRTPEFLSAPGKNDLSQLSKILQRVFSTGIPESFEFWGLRKNGEAFPKEVVAHKGRYFGQDVIITTAREITDRLKAEASLRKLSRAVEQSPAAVVITDLTGAIEYVNPAFTQFTGYSFEEVLGQNPRLLKSGEMPPEAYKELWDTLTAGEVWEGDFHDKKKNGELFWEHARISPIRDAVGRISGYVAVKEDITERKLAEAALKTAENRLRTLINVSPDMILFKDGEGRWLDANQAGLDLFHLTGADYHGKTDAELAALTDPIFREAFLTCDLTNEKAWQLGQPSRDEEIIPVPTGGEKIYDVIKVPVFGADGSREGLVALGRDITERVQDQELQAALHLISEAAQTTATLPELFTKIHQIIGTLLSAKNFFVALYDAPKDELTFPYFVDERDAAPGPRSLNDGTLAGRVIQTREAILLTPEARGEGSNQGQTTIGSESLDWLGVPLKSQSRTIGALVVQSYTGEVRYTTKDELLLEFVSGQVAAAIERKQAEEAQAEQLEELRRWQAVMMDREDRAQALKREVNEVLRRHGEPIRYASQEGGEP